MAIATALVEAPTVAAAPMSYWRTVACASRAIGPPWSPAACWRYRASAVLAPWLAPYEPGRRVDPAAPGAGRRRRVTCSERTSRGATC